MKQAVSCSLPAWNLEAVYRTEEDWEKDFARLRALAEKFASYRNRLGESAEILAEALGASETCDRTGEKLYVYAHLRSDENTGNSAARARLERIKSAFAELSPLSAWFVPEFSALPEATVHAYLQSPVLAGHRRVLEEIVRAKAHVLSEPEERLLGQFSEVTNSAENTFSLMNDADLTFGKISMNGETGELTHANYHAFMESPDRRIRRTAFRKMHGVYGKFRNTFASTLNATVKHHAVSAGVRHYPSALAASLFDDRIPEEVYTGLIETVHRNLAPLHRYIDLRRRVMKLQSIDMYDLYNPLVPECRQSYSWEDAVKLVRAAVVPLGKEYCEIWEKAFAERWIDAAPRKGKRSGAYSGGCFDTYPYILMSFDGTLDDVFTLAHEGGHSMHSFFSRQTQPYPYAEYSIFAAEIASTTNEILLFEHLIASSREPALQTYLLGRLADEIRTTVYRQTMFAEFELLIHRYAEAGTPLTADLLDAEYGKLNTLYYNIHGDRIINHEWARIPHFYYDFYVYKYATGMSTAIRLATGILRGPAENREKYLGFLKAGSSRDVLDIMCSAGVDLSVSEPVESALKYFAQTVEHLEKLLETSC